MADGFWRPDPLVFDGNVAENFRIFERTLSAMDLLGECSSDDQNIGQALLSLVNILNAN